MRLRTSWRSRILLNQNLVSRGERMQLFFGEVREGVHLFTGDVGCSAIIEFGCKDFGLASKQLALRPERF